MFQTLLPFCSDVPGAWSPGDHNKQLYGHLPEANFQLALFCRSIFGMTYVYNRLPQEIVDNQTVSLFQNSLTRIAREMCENGDPDWINLFSSRK